MEKNEMKYLVCLAFNKPREVLDEASTHRLTRDGYIAYDGKITGKGRVLVEMIVAAAKK